MNYRHFTIEERCCLREYYIKGKSYCRFIKHVRQFKDKINGVNRLLRNR